MNVGDNSKIFFLEACGLTEEECDEIEEIMYEIRETLTKENGHCYYSEFFEALTQREDKDKILFYLAVVGVECVLFH